MKIEVVDNKEILDISDNVFKVKYNKNLVHQIIVIESNLNRKNIKLNKNRSMIIGSNKKPWKQKGTGRARAGSKKSPIWRSGGVTFGNQVKSYKFKINKKMYKNALKCILSKLISMNKIFVFNNFNIDTHKTKNLVLKLKNNLLLDDKKNKKILILILNYNKNLFLSSRNLININVKIINNLNLNDLIKNNNILITIDALMFLEKRLT